MARGAVGRDGQATLSRERIVAAAVEILDHEGEAALTFRSLAARLATGSGAIHWYVADKGALLRGATEAVLGDIAAPDADPRALAVGVYDAIDAHPWVGTQIAREPWQPALTQVFDGFGRGLDTLGVPPHAQFDAASALLNFVLGLAAHSAAAARLVPPGTSRSSFLAGVAEQWRQTDPAAHPFLHFVAARVADHDDRVQFLAGLDLILAGIATLR